MTAAGGRPKPTPAQPTLVDARVRVSSLGAVQVSQSDEERDARAQIDRQGEALPASPGAMPAGAVPGTLPATSGLKSTDDLLGEVERLRAVLAQTQLKLQEANSKLGEWQALVEEAMHCALFNPESNDKARIHISGVCTAALVALPQVTRVKYVRCSFPSIRREAPRVRLAKYTSLSDSEWHLRWAPSWSVDVCVEGYHYIYFEVTMRISHVSVKGTVKADFLKPLGLGGVRLSFLRKPALAMDLESTQLVNEYE
ncbi:hypothetical protein T492DRAFT_843540 [Pavlovales sp. CCMP2436]|nr:hypothetical protein T492DRAFT_843540 [Pavlovales sp. CCMP2436]